jgi:cytochrome c oxidase subunit 2
MSLVVRRAILRPEGGGRRRRAARATLGILATSLVAAACTSDHQIMRGAGEGGARISVIGWFMFITSGVIAAVFVGLLAWALVRGGTRPAWLPENGFVIAGGIVLPAAVIVALTAFTLTTLNDRNAPGSLQIEVVGHQFWWEVHYPATGVTTANEFRIPAGRDVRITLRSVDVIHSFWVPDLDGKIDMIPGQTNHITLRAEHAGVYRGQCAEFCGLQHARMAFFIRASPPAEFDRWLAHERQPAAEPTTASQRAGREAFEQLPCASCHTITGTSADGTVGPDLTHLAERSTLAAGVIPNDRGHLGGWIANSQTIKPGNLMPPIPLEPRQLQALLDYLEHLK